MKNLIFLIIILTSCINYDVLNDDKLSMGNNGDLYDYNNLYLENYLDGHRLRFSKMIEGDKIPINSIIIPDQNTKSYISIEFPRNSFNDSFIKEMFFTYNEQNLSIFNHVFSGRGSEPILTKDKVILNIHGGLVFYLRDDVINNSNYKTFKGKNTSGVASKVVGHVYYSTDHSIITEKFKDFTGIYFPHATSEKVEYPTGTEFVEIDGEIVEINFSQSYSIPQKYEPKVIEE